MLMKKAYSPGTNGFFGVNAVSALAETLDVEGHDVFAFACATSLTDLTFAAVVSTRSVVSPAA